MGNSTYIKLGITTDAQAVLYLLIYLLPVGRISNGFARKSEFIGLTGNYFTSELIIKLCVKILSLLLYCVS